MAKILIVDDSSYLAKTIAEFLKKEGHDVVGTAENGAEGLARYRELSPDLTLLDITMPGMDGRACLREIMSENPEARVLMVSAVQARNAIIDCLSAGARGYVEKPLRFHDEDFRVEFRSAIDEALSDG